jgi:hypothetical protein
MTDDLKHRGPPDPRRINVHEAHEVRYWTKALGVTAVGVMAKDVRRHLGKS